MPYTSFYNHFINFSHYLVAFLLLFFLWPRFLFLDKKHTIYDQVFSHFIRMSFLVIVLGYLLVVFKLFELFSIIVILLVMTIRAYLDRKSISSIEEVLST